MTDAIYPVDLPQPQLRPMTAHLAPRNRRVPVFDGPSRFKIIQKAADTVYQLTWELNEYQFATFAYFYETTLQNGELPFELMMVGPNGFEKFSANFMGEYSYVSKSRLQFSVSAYVSTKYVTALSNLLTYPIYVKQLNCLGYWKLDELVGPTFKDELNQYNATESGGVPGAAVPGIVKYSSQAWEAAPTSSPYILISQTNVFMPTPNEFTMVAWVSNLDLNTIRTVATITTAGVLNVKVGVAARVGTASSIIHLRSGSINITFSGLQLDPSTVYMIAFTYNGLGYATAANYQAFVNTTQLPQGGTTGITAPTLNYSRIYNSGIVTDEVSFHDKVLTLAEITKLYNLGKLQ